ncbi:caspase family protein [Lentilitoribacter sp. Alg239-R112]|uniref:caspase family protein n=1 Tax=Lentilitoribacter sp. Alg239-R112 TaxID=2305987 RepID=UPI001AEE8820|nr:caspase family protein [Lentilitoribacter sp. Alg239-R112]
MLKICGLFLCLSLYLGLSAGTSFSKQFEFNSNLSCDQRDLITNRLANTTTVTPSQSSITIGGSIEFNWSRGSFPEREPVFLMISFDGPIRVKGDNLYVLLPNSNAAFGISWEQSKTRIVVPYYGRGVPKKGKILVEPVISGTLRVDWAVVGHSGCDENIETPNQRNLEVVVNTSPSPKIVIKDPDTLAEPDRIILNSKRDRKLEIYPTHYRLLDVFTSSEILTGVGSDPHFSPSGRFLVVPHGNEGGIFDAVDGKRLTNEPDSFQQSINWSALIWDKGDSFVYRMLNGYGQTDLHNLVAGKSIITSRGGARAAGGHNVDTKLDLENNLVIASTYFSSFIFKVTGEPVLDNPKNNGLSTPNQIRRDLKTAARITGLTQLNWPDGIKFRPVINISRLFDPKQFTTSSNWMEEQKLADSLKLHLVTDIAHNSRPRLADFDSVQSVASQETNWRLRSAAQDAARTAPQIHQFESMLGKLKKESNEVNKYDFSKDADYRIIWLEDLDSATFARHQDIQQRIIDDTGFNSARIVRENLCNILDGQVSANFLRAWNWTYNGHKFWLTTKQCAEGSGAFNSPETRLYSSKYPEGLVTWKGTYSEFDYLVDPDAPGNVCRSHVDACDFEIKVFDNYLILYSNEALAFAIIDTETGKLVNKQFNLARGDIFEDIYITAGAQHIMSLNSDGTFLINEIKDPSTALNGLYADDEIVVWTPDGRYDATAEGAHFIFYKFPGHIGDYSAQQFEQKMRVPSLAKKVLNGELSNFHADLTPPPIVKLSARQFESKLDIEIQAKSILPLQKITILEDGLITKEIKTDDGYKEYQISQSLNLRSGTKWVSIVATDESGVVSAPYQLEVSASHNKRKVRYLSVGINSYSHSNTDEIHNLGAAVEDAKLFATSIDSLSLNHVQLNSSKRLVDENASPDNILRELNSLVEKSDLGDTIAFYFAGHGLKGSDGNYYLATSNTDIEDIENTSLSFNDLSTVLKKSKARVLIFLDTCHSGLAGQGLFSTNDDLVEDVLNSVPSGIVVFSASKGREYALEDEFAKNGFFARALADVISEDRSKHDLNENGSIELSELFRGVKSLVVSGVKNAQVGVASDEILTQTPWMARNRMVGDFALF